MAPKIVVVGSANRDLVVKTERIPAPGETVIGGSFITAAGGKGGNQAVAAARLGAEVWFVACIGQDAFGDILAAELTAAGIHLDFLRRDAEEPTGVALIGVDAQGQNAIIVAPGANHRLCTADIDAARPAIAAADAMIVQLEIPMEAVQSAIETARACRTMVILNPAPVPQSAPLSDALLSRVDVLTPNEQEAAQLLGLSSPDGLSWPDVGQRLRSRGIANVVITLGDTGCLVADDAGARHIPAVSVHAVDTTAAGDCFTGALAVALAEGRSLDDAAGFAARAAAISVTRMGAQQSLPGRAEVFALEPPAE